MIPLDKSGQLQVEERFVVFCRNLSISGCSIIRNSLLPEKKWAIFFPHRRPIDTGSCCFLAMMVRHKTIPLGMYEMGFSFGETIEINPVDASAMKSKSNRR